MQLVDPRAGRFERGVVVVVLLAGFVFRQPISIVVAAAIATAGAALGTRSPVAQIWFRAETRRRHTVDLEPAQASRAESLLVAALLILATLIVVAGSVGLAAIPAAAAAVVAALDASGVIHPMAEFRRRRRT